MKYQKWEHRNGSLVAEKYSGNVEMDDIINNDDELLTDVPPEAGTLRVLTDISEATFHNIGPEEVAQLFQSIDAHAMKTGGMKLALYTGLNNWEDFRFVSDYSEHGSKRPMSVIPFNFLDSAMRWLDLSEKEQEQITKQLRVKL